MCIRDSSSASILNTMPASAPIAPPPAAICTLSAEARRLWRTGSAGRPRWETHQREQAAIDNATSAATDSWFTGCATPTSVTRAVSSCGGVTSKAGLYAAEPAGHTGTPAYAVTSAAAGADIVVEQ